MKPTKAYIIGAIVVVGLLALTGWFLLRPQGSVELALAPEEITMTITDTDPRKVQHGQNLRLHPGAYNATFSRDGFKSETTRIVVRKDQENRLVMALTPLTDAAKKIISDNPESVKVAKEYEQVKYQALNLPMTKACKPLKIG